MQTLFDSAVSVKSAPTFGRGIDHRPFVPSQDDLDWAAAFFGQLEDARLREEEDRELEEQAQQAAWDDQFRFPAGLCEMCGEPSDWLDPTHKLCGECLALAEHATLASVNERAGLGYRVF
jgi:hypothetical protein